MRWVRSVLVLLVGLAVFAAPATAAIKTPFMTTLALGQPGDPERAWQSGPILHVRGEPNEGTVAGDLNGPASIVNNYNLDQRTVDGTNWGTFVITSDEVTWEGTFRGTIRGGFNQDTFAGHGSDGSLLKGSFTQTGEFEFLLDGVILEPSAE
jgi:hypothetical protein